MIALDHVRKTYGRTLALRDFSLDVADAPLHVLQGPNGSGKSTALKVLAGVALPDQGMRTASPCVLGYQGHRDQFPASVQVRRTLYSQVRLHTHNLEHLAAYATRFGVDSYWQKKPAQLSQGMRQRAKLVRAFSVAPDLLLLDEPQAGLDADGIELLFDSLAGFLAAGGCAVVATHLTMPDLGVPVKTVSVG